MVVPSLISDFKVLKSDFVSLRVNTEVGSSMINTFGSCNKTLTISTLCFSPADKLFIGASKSNSKPYFFEIAKMSLSSALYEISSFKPRIKFSFTDSESKREKC